MKLKKPKLTSFVRKLLPKMAEKVDKSICPTCNKKVGQFRDRLSIKEYSLSGMCQVCQDKVFN